MSASAVVTNHAMHAVQKQPHSTKCKALLTRKNQLSCFQSDGAHQAEMHNTCLGIPADSFLNLPISMTSSRQYETTLSLVLIVYTRAQCALCQPFYLHSHASLTSSISTACALITAHMESHTDQDTQLKQRLDMAPYSICLTPHPRLTPQANTSG